MNVIMGMAMVALPTVIGATSTGWSTVGTMANRAAMSYFEHGRPRLIMTCSGTQTIVQVRGFEAAQQWPQPVMSVKFGDIERAERPNLTLLGDQTAFGFDFPISDSVLTKIRSGALIEASYRGKIRRFPIAPAAYRREFADRCAALIPMGMRKG